MKVLMIGGTGTISTAISKVLSDDNNVELYLLNRGNNSSKVPKNAKSIIGDINKVNEIDEILNDYNFDVVCDFLTYTEEQAKHKVELFKGKVKQFIFISTAVTYNHDIAVVINEDSEQFNKNSNYGQQKLKCEKIFKNAAKEEGFPVTIVRPTQTYYGNRIPLSVKGKDCYPVIKRIKEGKEVIIHGDGTSTWVCTHSEDFAKAFIGVVGNEKAINDEYQIMSDEVVNWNIIYNIIAEELGVDLNPVYIPSSILAKSKKYDFKDAIYGDKQYSVVFDTKKIKEAVPGFKCEIGIREGIKRYLKLVEENPQYQVEEPDFDKWCDDVIAAYKKAMSAMEEVM